MKNPYLSTLYTLNCLPPKLIKVIAGYLLTLSLTMKKHDFKTAGEITNKSPSAFSRLLNSSLRNELARQALNRAAKRRLKSISKRLDIFLDQKIIILVDATLIARKGNVENKGNYHSGNSKIRGHKFINIGYLAPDLSLIPLATIPVLTTKYCRDKGIRKMTEADLVTEWILNFPDSGFFNKKDIHNVLFIMDAGYDVKKICYAILKIQAHFVVALRSNRTISSQSVSKYFRCHRHLAWKAIRLRAGTGGKGSRRTYRIRLAKSVNLKGVGSVSIVCSETKRSRKRTRKYLAASDSQLSDRAIVKLYRRRWSIELWHREIKQGWGYIDCRCSKFSAIETHINFCLLAYCLHQEIWDGEKPPKLSVVDYEYTRRMEMAVKEQTCFGGKDRLKKAAAAAMRRMNPMV
jgi:hypothetical protein